MYSTVFGLVSYETLRIIGGSCIPKHFPNIWQSSNPQHDQSQTGAVQRHFVADLLQDPAGHFLQLDQLRSFGLQDLLVVLV